MPFLPPNQQCQSTEGNNDNKFHHIYTGYKEMYLQAWDAIEVASITLHADIYIGLPQQTRSWNYFTRYSRHHIYHIYIHMYSLLARKVNILVTQNHLTPEQKRFPATHFHTFMAVVQVHPGYTLFFLCYKTIFGDRRLYRAGCPFCHSTNTVEAQKETLGTNYKYWPHLIIFSSPIRLPTPK